MDFQAWFQIAIVCFFGAISPGPSLFQVIHRTSHGGRIAGIFVSIGHGVGITFYAILVVFGLSFVLNYFPSIQYTISLLGAFFLMYLGYKHWIRGVRDAFNKLDLSIKNNIKLFAEGFLIALINPKITVFFLALFSQFIQKEYDLFFKIILGATAGSIDMLWYILVSIIVSSKAVSSWFKSYSKILSRASGIMIFLFGSILLVRTFLI